MELMPVDHYIKIYSGYRLLYGLRQMDMLAGNDTCPGLRKHTKEEQASIDRWGRNVRPFLTPPRKMKEETK